VNGVATADWIDPLDLEGFVALQVHSGKTTDVLWRGLTIEDRGTREWPTFCDAERWRTEGGRIGRLLSSPSMVPDGALRVRVRGPGIVVSIRSTWICSGGPDWLTLAPGLVRHEDCYELRSSDLPLPDGQSWASSHEVVVSTWGDRLAVHVGGQIVIDVRDGAHRTGWFGLQHHARRGAGEIESAEQLSRTALSVAWLTSRVLAHFCTSAREVSQAPGRAVRVRHEPLVREHRRAERSGAARLAFRPACRRRRGRRVRR